jgi:acylphosphatase
MVEMNCLVFGKVQGVAYRTYAQESATQLGLVGYVKNLPDGSVEVLAQGKPDTLKEFVEYLNEGSIMSRVDSLAVEWGTVKRNYSEFFLLH